MTAVQLVYMPYLPIDYPPVGMSVLLGGLRQAGIDARLVHANIEFARRLGLDAYQLPDYQLANHFVEDWTFRDAVYPPSDTPPSWERDRSLSYEPTYLALLAEHRKKDIYAVVREMREEALRFVDELAQRLLDDGARVVAASTMHLQNLAALGLMKRVKALAPKTVTMLGGPGCEAEMGVAMHRRFPFVDYVVSGEPDAYLPAFLGEVLERGGLIDPARVPMGFFHPEQRATGRYPSPAPRLVLEDVEQAALPDYDDFFADLDKAGFLEGRHLTIPMETSRGCWYGEHRKCRFCSFQDDGLRYRTKRPERVLSEMKSLWERYGKRDLFIVDSNMERTYFKTVLPKLVELGSPYKIFWEMKVNLEEEHVELLARAGITVIEAGIESLVPEVLDSFLKGNDPIKCVQFLKDCMGVGVTNGWNFLLGAPGEKDEWYAALNEWLPSIFHLQPPMRVIRVQFSRFSEYFENAEKYGLHLVPQPGYRDLHPDADELGALIFGFDDPRLTEELNASVHRNRTIELMKQWRIAFFTLAPPRLVYKDDGQTVVIRDSRPVATEFRTELQGLDRAVFLTCLKARRLPQVVEDLGPQFGTEAVAAAVSRLVGLRLMLQLGEKVLSLATRPVVRFGVFDRRGRRRNNKLEVFRKLLPHRFEENALSELQELLAGLTESAP